MYFRQICGAVPLAIVLPIQKTILDNKTSVEFIDQILIKRNIPWKVNNAVLRITSEAAAQINNASLSFAPIPSTPLLRAG